MIKPLVLSAVVVASLLSFASCKPEEDVKDGASTGTPTPTPTPTPVGYTPTPTPAPTCNSSSGGMNFTSVPYVLNVTGTTISQVKLWISRNGGSAGSHSVSLEARQCGAAGTLLGTANASVNLANNFQYYEYTFNFSPTITSVNCAGNNTISLKLVNNTGDTLYFGAQNGTGSSCTMRVGADGDSSAPPVPYSGNWYVTGSFSN